MTKDEIRELRKAYDLTQENFARLVGVTLSTVAKWEAGETKPSPLAAKILEQLKEQNG